MKHLLFAALLLIPTPAHAGTTPDNLTPPQGFKLYGAPEVFTFANGTTYFLVYADKAGGLMKIKDCYTPERYTGFFPLRKGVSLWYTSPGFRACVRFESYRKKRGKVRVERWAGFQP